MTGAAQQVQQFIGVLFEPDDLIEIRRLPSGRSTWHRAGDLHEQADALNTENETGQHIYIGVNPRSHEGRGADSVNLGRCLWADFDDTTVEDALERVEAADMPTPTLAIDSGHGGHCYWRLNEPVDPPTWSRWQRDLSALLRSDSSVHDAPRLTRLPGFLNQKPPVAPCHIVQACPDQRVDLADLRETIPHAGRPEPEPTQAVNNGSAIASLETLAHAARYVGKCDVASIGERNSKVTKVSAALTHEFALTDAEAWPLLRAYNARSETPLDDDELRKCLSSGRTYGKGVVGSKVEATAHTRGGSKPSQHIAPFAPFPTDVLPECMSRFIAEAAAAIGCDECFIVLPLLSGVAAAIGNTRRIELKRTWKEPSILCTSLIAPSGDKKSPAHEIALGTLRQRQSETLAEHDTMMEKYEQDQLDYDKALRRWNGDRSAGPAPAKPAEPVAERLLCSDTTVEALAVLLQNAERGLLIDRDELSGFLASFDSYKAGKGADVAHYLEMHRAGLLIVDRKLGKRKTIHVARASVSITGTIQPQVLSRSLGQEHLENGLAARFLFAMPPRRTCFWSDADVSRETSFIMDSVFTGLFELEMESGADGKPVPKDLLLTPGARDRWIAFYNTFARERAELSDPHLSAAWSKLEGGAARLALVTHCVRVVSGDDPPDDPDTIDERSIETGITLARWFCHEARRVYALLCGDDQIRQTHHLLDYIRNRGGEITPRDLTRNNRQYPNTTAAHAALDELVRHGEGTWAFTPADSVGGRPSRVFRLVETTPADETPRDAIENGGFVDVGSVGDSSARSVGSRLSVNLPREETVSDTQRSADSTTELRPSASGRQKRRRADTDKTPTGDLKNGGIVGRGSAEAVPPAIPDGWTAVSWADELRRKASCCEEDHPDIAEQYRGEADKIDPPAGGHES